LTPSPDSPPPVGRNETKGANPRVLDSMGMVEATRSLPEQVAAAAHGSAAVEGLPDHDRIENVLVMGVGGSGVAGDVMAAVAAPFIPVPVVVSKSYSLPGFVGRGTLAFAVSFSGNTEETLEAVSEAREDGAWVVAVTSGGALGALAEEWGVPMLAVPSEIPQPRAAIGAMSVPPLMVLEQVGLFPGASRWVDLAVDQLAARRDELFSNWQSGSASGDLGLASEIAGRIGRTIPLFYGTDQVGGVAAQRWKNQVNENAKCPAFANVLPELCHNELAGWGVHGDVTRQLITVVNLLSEDVHPQVRHRVRLVSDVVAEAVAGVVDVVACGEGLLAQLFDLVLIGDAMSLALAIDSGVDPGPIPVLDWLKESLRATSA